MATETVAVISSSAVAIAAILFGWLQHQGGLKHQRQLADLDNVRDVLDDAAAELHRVAYALDDVRSSVSQHGPGFFKREEGTRTFTELGRHGQELDALTERLAVRLGRAHEVVVTFSGAAEAALAIYRAAGMIRLEPDSDGSAAADASIREFYGAQRAEFKEQRQRFDEAREAFVAAAQRTAGAQLPS